MPNSSGFVDFSQQLGVSGDEERRLLEQAMSRAQEATTKAQGSLAHAGQEAAGHYDANGQIVGESADLSKTASYSDYLQAKQSAAQAWAAVGGPTLSPRSVRGAMQGQLGVDAASRTAGDALHAREDQLGAQTTSNAASLTTQRAKAVGDAEMKKQALDDQKKKDDGAKAAYLAALTGGAHGRAAAGGAQTDWVGQYNPAASSQWAQQQGGWEAQQARNAGAGADQVKGIWDQYTGKGEFGQGDQRQIDQNMEREMDPWAVKPTK